MYAMCVYMYCVLLQAMMQTMLAMVVICVDSPAMLYRAECADFWCLGEDLLGHLCPDFDRCLLWHFITIMHCLHLVCRAAADPVRSSGTARAAQGCVFRRSHS